MKEQRHNSKDLLYRSSQKGLDLLAETYRTSNKTYQKIRNKYKEIYLKHGYPGLTAIVLITSLTITVFTTIISTISGYHSLTLSLYILTGVTFTQAIAGYNGSVQAKKRFRSQKYRRSPNLNEVVDNIEMAASSDEDIQENISEALNQVLEENNPTKLVNRYTGTTTQLLDILIQLTESNARTTVNGLKALHRFSKEYPEKTTPYLPQILEKTESQNEKIKGWAIVSTKPILKHKPEKSSQVLRYIKKYTNHPASKIREVTLQVLVVMDDEESETYIEEMTDDRNEKISQGAQKYLDKKRQTRNQPHEKNLNNETQEYIKNPPEKDFTDIAGMDKLKNKLKSEIIEPFSSKDRYGKYNISGVNGVLFHGPPGTGKTHVSHAIAGELGINYLEADISDLDSKYMAEGAENIKEMFHQARKNQPSMIFLDEVDSILGGSENSENDNMVNQMLREVSQLKDNKEDVLVVAASNDPQDIDDAMMRTGRFDIKMEIPPPDGDARWKIFNHHISNIEAPVNLIDKETVIHRTRGFVASDIKEIVDRSARKAVRREREGGPAGIKCRDIMDSIDEITKERGGTGEYVTHTPEIDFEDVVGMKELKTKIEDRIITPYEEPELYETYGLNMTSGVMLYGPPGTGKTYIARAVAGELGHSFIEVKASDLNSKYVGEGSKNIGKMFEEARKNQPCIIFVDEIDALATDRSGNMSQSETQMITQLLQEVSDINKSDDDVVVIGATNRIQDIDNAVMRNGRFDEKIKVPRPDAEARFGILDYHIQAPRADLKPDKIKELTEPGEGIFFSASDMQAVAREASTIALKDRDKVRQQHVETAIQNIKESKDDYVPGGREGQLDLEDIGKIDSVI